MIPPTGWLAASANQGANVLHYALPVPHSATYQDGAPAPIVVAAAMPVLALTIGGCDAVGEAGLNTESQALLVVTLRQTQAFGTVLVDRVDVPPPWSRCGTPPATTWTRCDLLGGITP